MAAGAVPLCGPARRTLRRPTLPLPRDSFPRRIETARLCLRSPDEQEAALYARLAQEAYATRSEPLSRDQACAFAAFVIGHWQRYGFGFLIVDVVGEGVKPTPIGHAGLKYVDAWPNHWPQRYDEIELGYSVVPSARGRGYVTEAARAVLTAAFGAFDVATVRAKCNRDNPKSAAVLLRCGMAELEPSDRTRRFEIER